MALLSLSGSREFKKWRRQRQRQRHKPTLWLVVALHVQHSFRWKICTYSVKRRREILIFEVLSTSRARNSKFFILCLCMKIIRAKQAKSVLCLFCTTWPRCNNSKTLNLAQSSILIWRFHCSSRRSLLRSTTRLQWQHHKFAYLMNKNKSFARPTRAVFVSVLQRTWTVRG